MVCKCGKIMNEVLIHYGAKDYIPELVEPIKNENWIKPKGGLWTSPINSVFGLKQWNDIENFMECDINNSFTLKLHDWTKIFIIDNKNDLINAPLIDSYFGVKFINFEYLSNKYDAIWLTVNGERQTRHLFPISLNGWDCESVLILNSKCCYQV